MKGMIGTVEQEFCPAGNGAEGADDQPVMIDRILIEHVVFLKIPRIMHKIVIHCVSPHRYGRGFDNTFQVNRLVIVRAGIYFFFRDRHIFSSEYF